MTIYEDATLGLMSGTGSVVREMSSFDQRAIAHLGYPVRGIEGVPLILVTSLAYGYKYYIECRRSSFTDKHNLLSHRCLLLRSSSMVSVNNKARLIHSAKIEIT